MRESVAVPFFRVVGLAPRVASPKPSSPLVFALGCGLGAVALICGFPKQAFAQGIATGDAVARSARPLPEGTVLPAVNYRDLAQEAGLEGINVSGAERNKQYIVETTGTGVAIFDYNNDGLQDVFLVNAGRLKPADEKPAHYLYKNLGGAAF